MILIKIGGGKNIDLEAVVDDIADLWPKMKGNLIIVHGGSQTRDEIARKMKIKVKVVESPSGITSVFSDQDLIDVFLMSYAGLINKRLTALCQKKGVDAVGLSGIDGRLWQAKPKPFLYVKQGRKVKIIRGNLSGKVYKINSRLIKLLLGHDFLPIITPPAITKEGLIVNTDSDLAISAMVKSLKIKTIISLFEAPGFLRDVNDKTSLISKIDKNQLPSLLKYAKGRMKKKVLGAIKAFEAGVDRIYWGDGRYHQPIKRLLSGEGTIISQRGLDHERL